MVELPQYRKVYETLRKHIINGVYEEGTLLPSENELCIVHSITRPTVRKALDALLNEGYILKHQGKGSIVIGKPKGIGILSLTGTTSAIGKDNLETRIIVKPEIRAWEKALSFDLTEEEKELGCIYMERLRIVNDKPVFYDITMLPNVNLPRFTSRNFENKSLFDILRKNYQIQVKGGEQKLKAISAGPMMQKYFNVKTGHPILQIDRKIETNRLNFQFYSQVICNTTEYTLFGTF